jgi:heptosyltransferase I
MNFLIVRLGALGDVVHAIPAAAALRDAFPDARIDWLVEARHRELVDLVTVVDRVIVVGRPSIAGWTAAVHELRQVRYDAALDLQGLLKSAVLARASGAARVIGFSIWHLREKTARPFYSEAGSDEDARGRHVVSKNLRLLRSVGVTTERVAFPLAPVASAAVGEVQAAIGDRPFALINPGAAWPNKRWPPDRFGEIAAFLREIRGLASIVLWGPGEDGLARAVVEASGGAATAAPPTSIADVLALSRQASLMVSGDTGPLHIASAAGTPTVAIFGPTDPGRNGPWADADVIVSRYDTCRCHYSRTCRQDGWCLAGVPVAEVTAAIQHRLSIHA